MQVDAQPLPSLACVINNYNYGRYVGEAIQSSISQTVDFQQILVVDDGSTDRSLDVIGAFGPGIRVIATENRGQTAACLTALRSVETDYVLFLDADDYLDASFVEQIAPHLAGEDPPVKIQCQLVTVDEGGRTWGRFPTYPIPYTSEQMRQDNEVIGFYASPPTSGNIIRCDALRRWNGSKLDPRGAIDGTLNLLLPYMGRVISLSAPLAFKREHQKNVSAWSAPTQDSLEREIRTFKNTWQEACTLMNWPMRDFDNQPPLYLLERQLLLAALGGQQVVRSALTFARALLFRRSGRAESLALSAWALSLCVPLARWRQWAIKARRSPVNRGGRVDKIVRFLLGKGKTANSDAPR